MVGIFPGSIRFFVVAQRKTRAPNHLPLPRRWVQNVSNMSCFFSFQLFEMPRGRRPHYMMPDGRLILACLQASLFGSFSMTDQHFWIAKRGVEFTQVRKYFDDNKGSSMKQAQAAWMCSESRATIIAGRGGIQL